MARCHNVHPVFEILERNCSFVLELVAIWHREDRVRGCDVPLYCRVRIAATHLPKKLRFSLQRERLKDFAITRVKDRQIVKELSFPNLKVH